MRFEPSQPWDWTIPGLIYAEIRSEFPKKAEQRTEFLIGAGGGSLKSLASGNPSALRFLREDEKALLVVGPDVISINFLRPYPNWPEFRASIEKAKVLYERVAKPKAFKRIGLRYINRIDLPEKEVRIEDYLTAVPSIPKQLPQTFGPFMQRVELPLPSLPGTLILQSGSHADAVEHPAFLLDLDCVTVAPEKIPLAAALEWIDQAHEQVETAFEACITDKTRSLFQGS